MMYSLNVCVDDMLHDDGKNGEKYKPDKDEEYHTYVDIFWWVEVC